jgi:hypothetical protein
MTDVGAAAQARAGVVDFGVTAIAQYAFANPETWLRAP